MAYNPIALSRAQDTIAALNPTIWISGSTYKGYPSGRKIYGLSNLAGNRLTPTISGLASPPTVALSSQNSLPGLVYPAGSLVGHTVYGALNQWCNAVGRTVFCVFKTSSLANSRTIVQTDNYGLIATASALKTFSGSGTNTPLTVSGFTVNTTTLVTLRWNQSTKLHENWRNGANSTTGTTTSAETLNVVSEQKMNFGGVNNNSNTSAVVTIYEYIYFPVVLSDVNRAIVESYLNSKWAIY
jgi:hypothetical protein